MLRQTDSCAYANRWSRKAGPVALFCGGLLLCVLCAPLLPGAPLALAAVLLAAFVGARIPSRIFLRALLVPLGFIAVGALGLIVELRFRGGLEFGWTPEGVTRAWSTSLRAFCASSVLILFAHSIPVVRLLSLLRRLRISETLLDLLHLSYRHLFLLDESREQLVRAQDNRLGYANAAASLRSGSQAGAALFTRAVVRAVRMENGLAARGYEGCFRVLEEGPRSTWRDWLLASLVPAGIAAFACVTGGQWIS